jgi:SAM-dependent methyltransferase
MDYEAPQFCPICQNVEKLTEIDKFNSYRIFYCPRCRVEFSHPMENVDQLYSEAYSGKKGLGQYEMKMKAARDVLNYADPSMLISYERAIFRAIRRDLPPHSVVLDIGCGYGRFLAVLRQASYVPIGIDIAEPPIKILQEEGFTAFRGSVDEYPKNAPHPKAITLMEVLEHVIDPVGFISAINSHFPKARLYISVPSHRRWLLKNGPRQASDYPPHHWYHFTPKTLRYILEKNGYKCALREPLVSPLSLGGGLRSIVSRIEGEDLEGGKSRPSIATHARIYGISPRLLSTLRRINKIVKYIIYTPLAVYYNVLGYRATSFIGEAIPINEKDSTFI